MAELRQGWMYVLAAFLGIGGCFASLYFYTSGLFIKPLSTQFGWTRSEASLGATAATLGCMLAMPFAGRLIDRFGEMRVALVSGSLFAVGLGLLGLVTAGLASFLAITFLLAVAAAGANLIAYNRVIVRHFSAKRGLALGMAMTGTVIGATLAPPIIVRVIAGYGWRAGYLALALAALLLTGVAAALLRRESKPPARAASEIRSVAWGEILGRREFWSIAAIIFLAATAVLGTTLHLVPLLTDRGWEVASAGRIAALLGIAVIGGRVFTGLILDRFDAGVITAVLFAAAALGMLALWSGNPGLTIPGALLIGFGLGTEADLLAYLLGLRFPVRTFGSVYGAMLSIHALGAGVGGMAAGVSFDRKGNYDAWLLIAAACMIGAGLIAFMTQRGRAIPQSPPHSDPPRALVS